MAQLDSYKEEVEKVEELTRSVSGLTYTGDLALGVLASKHPEILQHVCSKRGGGDLSKVAVGYVQVLKAFRKLLVAIEESPECIKSELIVEDPPQLPLNVMVPFKAKKPRAIPMVELVQHSDSVSEALHVSKLSIPSEIIKFWSKHLIHVCSLIFIIAKYAPVLLMYGLFLSFILGLLVLGTRPELLVDWLVYVLAWLPEYFAYSCFSIVDRTVTRMATSMDPLTMGNRTSSVVTIPEHQSGGFWIIGSMLIAVLWRTAPR